MAEARKFDPRFLVGFKLTLGVEGGYSDVAGDPGGATRWGITEAVARSAGYEGAMQELPQAVAQEIAYRHYWLRYNVAALAPPACWVVFDSVYNSGDLGVVWLQKVLGVSPDGVLGTQTAHAASRQDPTRLAALAVGERLEALTRMSGWGEFGKGWTRRCATVLREALTAEEKPS